jgi:iron complex outermembrane receptor protein
VTLLLPAQAIQAQTPESTKGQYDSLSLEQLLNLKVALPTMESEGIAETPAAVTVYTEADIRALGALVLDDLLAITPGFDIRRFRGPYTIMTVRGIGSGVNERILLMIDGVRVNDLYSDGTARTIRVVHLAGVQRVEIIRGPASALYGADALAGVINVVTKEGSSVGGTNLFAGYGSYGTLLTEGSFGLERGKLKFSAYGGYGDSDGQEWDIAADGGGRPGVAKDTATDGYGGIKFSHGDRFELNANFGYRKDSNFISVSDLIHPAQSDPGSWTAASLTYKHPLGAKLRWNTTLAGGSNRWGGTTILNALPNPVFPDGVFYKFVTQEYHGDLDSYLQYSGGAHSFIGGVGGRIGENPTDKSVTFNGPVEPENPTYGKFTQSKQRQVFSAYGQYRWAISKAVKFTGGVRFDDYSDFGNTVNPRFGLVWAPSGNSFARATYGHAFRAPAYRELYSNNPVFKGDETLGPETVDSFELAGGVTPAKFLNLRLAVFRNEVADAIITVPAGNPQAPGQRRFTNGGELVATGFEAEASTQFGRFTLRANYTYTDSRTTITQPTNVEFDTPHVPKNLANLILVGDVGKWLQIGTDVVYRDDRPRDPGDQRSTIGSFAIWNGNINLREFGVPGLEIQLVARNILDEEYYGPSSYPPKVPGAVPDDIPCRGREVMVGLRFRR